FAVNGLVDEASIWKKEGLNPGDCLVLTKPLGTGTILAADMRHRAKGEWVEGAIRSMMQSNRCAADVLRDYSVSACTDVTGFGLAGHLREMADTNGLGVEIDAEALPLLPGASDCIEMTTSTLHEANMRSSPVENGSDILFDPQTSGGLLAGVPQDQADDCVRAIKEAGYHLASVVGIVTEHPGLRLRIGERHV
ncbi:MAG: selenide, water dikinase SelD, partial [Gammaproteobacteria bacterium]|nr:selenide, water dikinase SelD [Gammaproteobacteria bacterium]